MNYVRDPILTSARGSEGNIYCIFSVVKETRYNSILGMFEARICCTCGLFARYCFSNGLCTLLGIYSIGSLDISLVVVNNTVDVCTGSTAYTMY